MHTGEGLHRFVDPVDDEVYLYTQFEVADARRVFACFDQPDLKAHLHVHGDRAGRLAGRLGLAPPPTPSRPAGTAPASGGSRRRRACPRYVTALVAGPYHVVRGELTATGRPHHPARRLLPGVAGRVPRRRRHPRHHPGRVRALRDSCSTSRYPFAKYDQLFVPEFNAGAMENAGAVTITETYVFRSKVPEATDRAPGADDPARAGAHVVRRPRHHALVGRPVAQRVVRRVRLDPLPGRGHPVDDGLDDVPQLGEVLGLPAGPARLDPPDRRRHPRPGRRRGQLRRDHLRQGRLGAQAAGPLGRHDDLRRRAAPLLPAARLGQHHAGRPARRAGGRPAGATSTSWAKPWLQTGRGHHPAAGGRDRRRGP